MDVAEALVSFDAQQDSQTVRKLMIDHDFDVVGVRIDGSVVGYALVDDLTEGQCGEHLRYFGSDELVLDTASLPEVVPVFDQRKWVFVTMVGTVGAIVTRADLEKPPVRVFLFGLVTILEQVFRRIITEQFPDDSWTQFLSDNRIAKAQKLQKEKARRKSTPQLIDCLQLSDKGTILFKQAEIRNQFGFTARNQADDAMRRLEQLRNSLAHSQPIVKASWQTIDGLCTRLDEILKMYEK